MKEMLASVTQLIMKEMLDAVTQLFIKEMLDAVTQLIIKNACCCNSADHKKCMLL